MVGRQSYWGPQGLRRIAGAMGGPPEPWGATRAMGDCRGHEGPQQQARLSRKSWADGEQQAASLQRLPDDETGAGG